MLYPYSTDFYTFFAARAWRKELTTDKFRELERDIIAWVRDNIDPDERVWYDDNEGLNSEYDFVRTTGISFANEADCIAFKLRWDIHGEINQAPF